MNARRVAILLVAGLAVIGFAIWVSSKRHLERATLTGDLVLPGLESALNSVTEVRLAKGEGTLATLRKGAADWSVGERNYPADSGKVRKLLLDLAALNVVEEKTRTPENYPLLGVEDVNSPKATGTRVESVTPGKTYALIVGKSSSGKSGYVRVVNSPQSILAAPLLTLDADPRQWLDHSLLDVTQDRIREFTVKPAAGLGYTATRATKEQPDFTVAEVPKARELSSPAAADPIAGSLGGLTLDDVRRTQDGAAVASHVTFRTFDGLEVEVTGHKDGTKTFIAIAPRSTAKESQAEAQALDARVKGWEFEIPSYKFDGMFRPLEDLLKKLPEPAAKKGKEAAQPADGVKTLKKPAAPAGQKSPNPG